jgi:hypothetical protein
VVYFTISFYDYHERFVNDVVLMGVAVAYFKLLSHSSTEIDKNNDNFSEGRRCSGGNLKSRFLNTR